MKVILVGALGRMGRAFAQELDRAGMDLIARVDRLGGDGIYPAINEVKERADVIVDFSSRSATEEVTSYALSTSTPLVIAATGHTEADRAIIASAAKSIPIFLSSNMSFGVELFKSLCERLATAFLYADVEIVETHHNKKQDAPSGTALAIAERIVAARGLGQIVIGRTTPHKYGDVGISSLRLGSVAGIHEVIFDTGIQRFSLKHEASSRKLYAVGAVNAVNFICSKPAGLYGMSDLAASHSHDKIHLL